MPHDGRRGMESEKQMLKRTAVLEKKMIGMTDEGLAAQTTYLKKRLADHVSESRLLPHAFAAVREAGRRVLDIRAYDEQIYAALELCRGRIVEMKTGEGKSLVAALAAYPQALSGHGVHIITVNDYLAARDAEEIGNVLRMLGLTVGCVLHDSTPEERRDAYACDVTYVTGSEAGFDWLRDGRVQDSSQRVMRGLFAAVIDEADSVMIDDADVPLIISGQGNVSPELYRLCDLAVRHLVPGSPEQEFTKTDAMAERKAEEDGDYSVSEKYRRVHLTEVGRKKVAAVPGLEGYPESCSDEAVHAVGMALQAHGLMKRDRDYVVKDGDIVLIDSNTGRLMPGRMYSGGLHQALEAKEGLDIRPEALTFSSVSYQAFFNMYERKCGMTGTAWASRSEFKAVYGMKVVCVPTHEPMIRKDMRTAVYATADEKWDAALLDVAACHLKGQPVLVGTRSVADSEMFAKKLEDLGIPCRVLNAVHHAEEADIISHAGEHGSVTVATNMAGRGVDIRLDEEARAAGGLYVLGAELNDSGRIDDQLRGRSGRQGDPGESRFYASLEDRVPGILGTQTVLRISGAAGSGAEIGSEAVSKMFGRAQKMFESDAFGRRRTLMDYDSVNCSVRSLFLAQREYVLQYGVPEYVMEAMAGETADRITNRFLHGNDPSKWDSAGWSSAWTEVFRKKIPLSRKRKVNRARYEQAAEGLCTAKSEEFDDTGAAVRRNAVLRCMDWQWALYLRRLDALKEEVSFAGWGGTDPLAEYARKAWDGFGDMMRDVSRDSVRLYLGTDSETGAYVKEDS